MPTNKQKPTKVTKDDLELAAELSRITTIRGLLDGFRVALLEGFATLKEIAETGNNPVLTFLEIGNTRDSLETSLQFLQAELLRELGQVDEEDAHALADSQAEEEPVLGGDAVEIDEALGNDPENEKEED